MRLGSFLTLCWLILSSIRGRVFQVFTAQIKIGTAIGFVCCLINLAHTSAQSGIKGSDDSDDANIKLDDLYYNVHHEITDMTIQLG